MFRIRRIFDDALPIDRKEIAHVQQILRTRFPDIREQDVVSLPAKLRSPLKYQSRHPLFAADGGAGNVRAAARPAERGNRG